MDSDEWITDEEGDEYYRLKFDNIKKTKFELGKFVKLKSKKYKRIDLEDHQKIKELKNYLEENVYPSVGLKTNTLYSQEDLDKLFIISEEYNLEKKPEVGSCLIFEINQNNNLIFTGVSKEYYEATTKILLRSLMEKKDTLVKNNLPPVRLRNSYANKKRKRYPSKKMEPRDIIKKLEFKKNLKLRREKKLQNLKPNIDDDNYITYDKNNNKINQISDTSIAENPHPLLLNKKKKKKSRKKHKNYIRNSTIITINQIHKEKIDYPDQENTNN